MTDNEQSGPAAASPVVLRNDAEHQYEIWLGDTRAGIAGYREKPGRISFTHTVVDPEFGGQGLGSILAKGALDDTVARGETIVPYCPFITAYLRKHHDYDQHVDWPPTRDEDEG